MEGRWGRRVFGRIQKGRKYTRFYLEITVSNGLVIYRQIMVPNHELRGFPGAYKFTLDKMTYELEQHYLNRNYTS